MGNLKKRIFRACTLECTDAECPVCGGNVTEIRGGYSCISDSHPNLTNDCFVRSELDGEVKWWHGRIPFSVWFNGLLLYVLYLHIREAVKSLRCRLLYGRSYEKEQQAMEEAKERERRVFSTSDISDKDNKIISPRAEESTVQFRTGGRTWKGSAEEFKALRDRLNEVEFRD